MRKVIGLITVLVIMAVSMEVCFASVNIPATHVTKGKIPKGTRVVYELSEKDTQKTLRNGVITLDMTRRKKATFKLPINDMGWYEYNVIKRVSHNGSSRVDPKKYTIKVFITNDNEASYAISTGKGKEDSVHYKDVYQSPRKRTRSGEQTGDKIFKRIVIGIIAGLLLFIAYRVSKWRSADSLDI